MSNIIKYIPEAEGDEALYLSKLLESMSPERRQEFSTIYRARRKDPQLILISCLLGLIGIAGIHRFLLNQVGMGILYIFTSGLCFIGTIVDLINYKDLAFRYNRKVAREIKALI